MANAALLVKGLIVKVGLAYRMGGTYERDALTDTVVRLVRTSGAADWLCSTDLTSDIEAIANEWEWSIHESRLHTSEVLGFCVVNEAASAADQEKYRLDEIAWESKYLQQGLSRWLNEDRDEPSDAAW